MLSEFSLRAGFMIPDYANTPDGRAVIGVDDLDAGVTFTPDEAEYTCEYCGQQVWDDGGEIHFSDERQERECLDHEILDGEGEQAEDGDGTPLFGEHVGKRVPLGWLEEVETTTSTGGYDGEVGSTVKTREHNGWVEMKVWRNVDHGLVVDLEGWAGMILTPVPGVPGRFVLGNG